MGAGVVAQLPWPHFGHTRTLNAAIYCAPVSSISAGKHRNGRVADKCACAGADPRAGALANGVPMTVPGSVRPPIIAGGRVPPRIQPGALVPPVIHWYPPRALADSAPR